MGFTFCGLLNGTITTIVFEQLLVCCFMGLPTKSHQSSLGDASASLVFRHPDEHQLMCFLWMTLIPVRLRPAQPGGTDWNEITLYKNRAHITQKIDLLVANFIYASSCKFDNQFF